MTPMTWTDRPAPPPSPARSITSGEMTVRSAPVSTIKVSATPLRRASTVIGAPGETLSATGSFAVGGGIGRAWGVFRGVAVSRNVGGIEARSAV